MKIIMNEAVFDKIKSAVAPARGTEEMAVCPLYRAGSQRRYVVGNPYDTRPSDFEIKSAGLIALSAQAAYKLLGRAEAENADGILNIHSHLSGHHFSAIDDKEAAAKILNVQAFLGNEAIYIRGLFCRENWRFEIFNEDHWLPVETIKHSAAGMAWLADGERVDVDDERHLRHVPILSRQLLNRLSRLKIGVVGCGGNGSQLIRLLAHLGVQTWHLIDADKVELSNSNRLFGYRYGDAGAYKAQIMKREILAIDPGCLVEISTSYIPGDGSIDAIGSCDIVFGCVDDHYARYILSRVCSENRIPLIDIGCGLRLSADGKQLTEAGAQAAVQLPGGKCIPCLLGLSKEALFSKNQLSELPAGYIENGSGAPPPASVVMLNDHAALLAIKSLLALMGEKLDWSIISLDYKRDIFTKICSGGGEEFCDICGPENTISNHNLKTDFPFPKDL